MAKGHVATQFKSGIVPGGLGGRLLEETDLEGLTTKQRLFVETYLINLNGTQSAILAGYSPKSAGAAATDLLKVPKIARALAVAKQRRLERLRISQDEALRELRLIVHSDINVYSRGHGGKLVVDEDAEDIDGNPLDNKGRKVLTRAVQKVKQKSRYYTDDKDREVAEHELEIALHPKVSALSLYMDHLGLTGSQRTGEGEEAGDDNALVILEIEE